MKTTFVFVASLLLATSVQAAQISWGLTGAVTFNGTKVGANGATFALVYLGTATEWSASAAASVANDVLSETENSSVVSTKKTNNGSQSTTAMNPYVFTWADTTSIANNQIKDGDSFAYLVATTQDGKDYYWASEVYTVSESSPNWNGTSKTLTMSQTAGTGPNNNWKAVPEPSVAIMGLLGLGMLLKRRKA